MPTRPLNPSLAWEPWTKGDTSPPCLAPAAQPPASQPCSTPAPFWALRCDTPSKESRPGWGLQSPSPGIPPKVSPLILVSARGARPAAPLAFHHAPREQEPVSPPHNAPLVGRWEQRGPGCCHGQGRESRCPIQQFLHQTWVNRGGSITLIRGRGEVMAGRGMSFSVGCSTRTQTSPQPSRSCWDRGLVLPVANAHGLCAALSARWERVLPTAAGMSLCHGLRKSSKK